MTRPVPDALAAFQQRFSAMLRTPLDRSTGTLRATPARYPAELQTCITAGAVPVDERLAVYNRQYWFRFFTVLQGVYPLTTALVGAWAFNGLVARFLEANPPTGHELGMLGDGLAEHLRATPPVTDVPATALAEVLAHDVAFHRAWTAPNAEPLRMTADLAPRLERGRFVRAPSFSLLRESWPWVTMRHELPTPLGEHRVPMPKRHPAPRDWLVGRAGSTIHVVPLEPAQAVLLEQLSHDPLPAVLARLEDQLGTDACRGVQRWLAHAMDLGVWTAFEDTP